MWTEVNPDNFFHYQKHSLMDLNSSIHSESPFILGIQTEWQLEMMEKIGNNSTLSIEAAYGTTQTRVRH